MCTFGRAFFELTDLAYKISKYLYLQFHKAGGRTMNQGDLMEVTEDGAGAGEVVDPEIASGAKQPQKR